MVANICNVLLAEVCAQRPPVDSDMLPQSRVSRPMPNHAFFKFSVCMACLSCHDIKRFAKIRLMHLLRLVRPMCFNDSSPTAAHSIPPILLRMFRKNSEKHHRFSDQGQRWHQILYHLHAPS